MLKLKRFIRKHTWLIIIVACLLFIPQSFSYQAKLNMRVIVTGMAVDKVDNGYEITAQVVMPTPGSEAGGQSATLGFISEQGKSISEGIQKIAYKIGKTAGLSHISYVIVGQSMLEDNLAEALDYFVRDPEINAALMLLISPTTGKEMINKTNQLELSAAVGLQQVFIYKQSSLNGEMMLVEEFINNAFGLSKSSTASGLLITTEGEEKLGENTDETINQSSSSGQSGNQNNAQPGGDQNGSSGGGGDEGNNSQSSKTSQNGRIKYYNDIYYFKNGKYVNKLDGEEEMLGFYLSNTDANTGILNVENVTGGVLKNATVGLQFREKSTKTKATFEDGKPKFTLEVKIKDIQLLEILNEGQPSQKIYHNQNDQTILAIKEAIKDKIATCIEKAFEKAKADNVDIFKIADELYQHNAKEWKTYFAEKGEAYLHDINLDVNVVIQNIN